MIVSKAFDGDEDHTIKAGQHEHYHYALGTIVSACQRHFRRAEALLETSSADVAPFLSVTSYDHRTLQACHDRLAAAWRFRAGHTGQMMLFGDQPTLIQEALTAWRRWLSEEMESWIDSPNLVRHVMTIALHQNSERGYEAEDQLGMALIERFSSVPWLSRMPARNHRK